MEKDELIEWMEILPYPKDAYLSFKKDSKLIFPSLKDSLSYFRC